MFAVTVGVAVGVGVEEVEEVEFADFEREVVGFEDAPMMCDVEFKDDVLALCSSPLSRPFGLTLSALIFLLKSEELVDCCARDSLTKLDSDVNAAFSLVLIVSLMLVFICLLLLVRACWCC